MTALEAISTFLLLWSRCNTKSYEWWVASTDRGKTFVGIPSVIWYPTAFSIALGLSVGLTSFSCEAGESPLWRHAPSSLMFERLPVSEPIGPVISSIPSSSTWLTDINIRSHAATNFVTVRQLDQEWKSFNPRRASGRAFQSASLETILASDGWELAAWSKESYVASAAEGALYAINSYKSRSQLPEQQLMDLKTSITGLNRIGIRLAKTLTWDLAQQKNDWRVRLTGSINMFSLQRFTMFSSWGTLLVNSDVYRFDASAIRHDSSRSFDGFGSVDSKGSGFSSDVGLMVEGGKDFFLNVSFFDFLSAARIQNVATESARFDSNVRAKDSDGYLLLRPSITGQLSGNDLKIRSLQNTSILTGWRVPYATSFGNMILGARLERLAPISLNTIWISLPLQNECYAEVDKELNFGSFGIGFRCSWVKAIVRSSSVDFGSATSLGLALSINKSW